jgi:shikimate dehydrogenase
MMIDGATRVCATFGNPNKRSTAPIMHNAAFDALGVNYRYLAFEPDDIGQAIDAVRALKFVGVSVSKPFKQTVLAHVDELDRTAAKIGAVNCVHNVNGKLIGYNSDWIGAVDALKEKCPVEGRRVAVLGSGGAARAIVYGLLENKCSVFIFARNDSKGRELADNIGASFGGFFGDVPGVAPEILVNATSVGMAPDTRADLPVPESAFATARTVMDIVVRPDKSRLLERAERAGCTTIGGVRMLVLQGAFTFQLFTGLKAPTEAMQDAVERALLA